MPTILYEDNHLLLVEKPINLSAQTVDGGDSLPHRLEQTGYPVKPVHRLDKPTGGVMVYARTDKAAAKLSALVVMDSSTVYSKRASRTPLRERFTTKDLLRRTS